ncbi:MAG: matrixin family metalloprotease [Candidatus Krumholzibacteriia bacterium]
MPASPTRPLRLVTLALVCLLLASPLLATEDQSCSLDPVQMMLRESVGQLVLRDAGRVFGVDSPQYCITSRSLAACIHPDTPPERVDEILRSLPTWIDDDRYNLGQRWSATAIDGSTGGNGQPIHLTYSFVDDGVYIPGGSGEAGSASRLYATMNGYFGNEAVWKAIFAGMFNDWGKHIGITYEEVADDGATFPTSAGVLGERGDVRISGHPIDGVYGILAYNYFPNGGDMVLDTAEYWNSANNNYIYLRNVVRHEHGHGIGLQHVLPENCSKLMEAYACTNFDGPQDDDIRGGMRYYGDTLELNNNAGAATDLGTLDGVFSLEWPASLTTSVDYDFYRFTTAGPARLDVTVDPVGFRYDLEGVLVQTDEIMDLAFRVLGGVNGADVLATVNDVGLGQAEVLNDFLLPAAGDYWVFIYRAAGTPDVQRYDLTLAVEPTGITAADDGPVAVRSGLSLFPNPFNPRTTARFQVAAAGPVSLEVFDVAGKLVRRLDGQAAGAGWMEMSWDGRNGAGGAAPSGNYLLRVRTAETVLRARAMLLE